MRSGSSSRASTTKSCKCSFARFPNYPIIITTLTDGWQPGYIPPADAYGRGIYQEKIAVVAAGSAEQVMESIAARMSH